MKESLKRIKIIKNLVRAIRRVEYKRLVRMERMPFDGDRIMTQTIEFLLKNCEIKAFIETGTYVGQTCRYIASQYPHLPITTIENNPDIFDATQSVLRPYSNIKSILGDSAATIAQLMQNGINGLPLFFLDAHWYDYLPLPDEIYSIGQHLADAIMVIHDFNVPNMDYGYDICNGNPIGIEMLVANINKNKNYRVYFPHYTYQQAYNILPKSNQKLRGYAIVFQEAQEAAERFVTSQHIQWYIRGNLE